MITRSSWACEAELALMSQATFRVTFECLAEPLSESLSESGSLQSLARARPTFVAAARQPNTSRLPESFRGPSESFEAELAPVSRDVLVPVSRDVITESPLAGIAVVGTPWWWAYAQAMAGPAAARRRYK